MRAAAVGVAMLLAGATPAQMPTASQIEAAAAWAAMRPPSPGAFEARVVQASANGGAALRIVRQGSAVRAERFAYGTLAGVNQREGVAAATVRCVAGVCIAPLPFTEPLDWGAVVRDLATGACRPGVDGPGDAVLWIQTAVDGVYREETCGEARMTGATVDLYRLIVYGHL